MSYNLGDKSPEEPEKVNVDLAASGMTYKECMNIPVIPAQVEADQLPRLQEYFKARLHHYRGVLRQFPGSAFFPKDE